jgi:large subunit ribosomal protein L21
MSGPLRAQNPGRDPNVSCRRRAGSLRRINRMYAIVNINGVQTRVQPDEVIDIPRLTGDPGAKLTFEQLLLVGDGDKITVGQPFVKGATATIEVLEHLRGPKLRIFKFKRRREYRRRRGHRDELTRVRVTAITA